MLRLPQDFMTFSSTILRFYQLSICIAHIWEVKDIAEPLRVDSVSHPAIICDAGSTGSRVFAFYVLDHDGSTEGNVVVELMGRSSIGLSEFADSLNFEGASETILPFISKGISRLGNKTPIYIFATGGVRQLPEIVRESLWENLTTKLHGVFEAHQGALHIKVIDGDDEALFGLLSANYLLNDLPLSHINLPLSAPVGVLDLGGSSLEIAIAGDDRVVGTHDDILISFQNLGLKKMWLKLADMNVTSHCLFESGDGPACRKVLREIVMNDGDFDSKMHTIDLSRVERFVAISAFAYTMDFANWIMSMKTSTSLSSFCLDYPSPSISSIQYVCDEICSYPLLDALFRQHRFTTAKEVNERCFSICYVAEVLSILFESRVNQNFIRFLVEVCFLMHFTHSRLGTRERD